MRSSLFGQLHYNYNNRLKKALQDHNNSKVSLYDEQILKAKYPEATCDVWHTPLLPENNIPNTEHHQPVTEMPVLVEDHELSAENNQTMFEHETVNVHVKVLLRLLKVSLLVTGVKVPRLKVLLRLLKVSLLVTGVKVPRLKVLLRLLKVSLLVTGVKVPRLKVPRRKSSLSCPYQPPL